MTPDILGSSVKRIQKNVTRLANWLYDKKQSKITISSIEPAQPDDGDFWIDMGSVHTPPSYNNFLEILGPTASCTVEGGYIFNVVDVDCSNLAIHIDYIDSDCVVYDTHVEKYIDVDCNFVTSWMLTCGAKTYDRMYATHYRAAYYGYYGEEHNNYMAGDKYEPVPIGKLDKDYFSITDEKGFYITALMAMYDERNQSKEGNGFNVLFGIYIPDGVIPFKSITIGFHHQLGYPTYRNIVYTRTILDSEFSTDSIYTRYATWPDETNGAIPKLFEVLYDFWRWQVGEIPLEVSVITPKGMRQTYYVYNTQNKKDDTSIILPTISSCSIVPNGVQIKHGYIGSQQPRLLSNTDSSDTKIEEICIQNYSIGNGRFKNELVLKVSPDVKEIQIKDNIESILSLSSSEVDENGYIHIRDERVVAIYEAALSSPSIEIQMR